MNLHPGDIVVVDASVMVTKNAGTIITERLLKKRAILVVSNELLSEYRRNVAKAGYSPAALEKFRLERLKRHGLLFHIKDEKLKKIVPENMPDHHVGNLVATVNAKALVIHNKKATQKLKNCFNLPVVNMREFLDCRA